IKVGSITKPAGTAVTVQTQASASATVATVTIAGFNPGASANRLLVVGLSADFALTGVTVSFGVAPLLPVPGSSVSNGTTHTELWYLVNPGATAAIVAAWTGNHAVVMGAVAFNNVDQTLPIQNGTSTTGTSTAPA